MPSHECNCRDCNGDPCLCSIGDHCDAAGPHCSCCGDTNYRWMGYLGALAMHAKRLGISQEEMENRWVAQATKEIEDA